MSIDPTSAPIPVARNENSSSSENRRSESQGSATGCKDGQFGSFWDRALTGAQKLFSRASLFESNRSEKNASQESDSKAKNTTFESENVDTFSLVPCFASSGLHRFSSAFTFYIREDAREKGSSEPTASAKYVSSQDRTNPADEVSHDILEHEERTRENSVSYDEEKSADRKPANPPIAAPNVSSERNENLLSVDNQQLIDISEKVGINSAKHAADMSSKLQNPNLPTLPGSTSRDLEGHMMAVMELGEGHSKSQNGVSPIHQQALHNQKSGSNTAITRKSLSPVLDSAQNAKSSTIGQVSHGNANPSSPTTSQSSSTDHPNVKTLDFESGGTRENEDKSSRQESRSSPVSMSRSEAPKASRHAPVSGDSTTVETNASKRIAEAIESHLNRGPRGADASFRSVNSGLQTPSVQNAPKKPGGIAGSNFGSETTRPVDAGNQLRFGEKVDGNVAKSGELSRKASRSKGDASQGLSVGESPSASKTRISGLIKSQQSGYASKSTSETKQVYEALVKSVDRLVANKNDSISVKINFDGGGMLKLRVSMDSGRVNSIMQTDLSGLESMIKSSWTELSNELNQKGIKLNTPQFSNSESQGNRESATYDSLNREANSEGGGSGDSKRNRTEGPLSDDSRQSTLSKDRKEAIGDTDEASQQVVADDQELKTYA